VGPSLARSELLLQSLPSLPSKQFGSPFQPAATVATFPIRGPSTPASSQTLSTTQPVSTPLPRAPSSALSPQRNHSRPALALTPPKRTRLLSRPKPNSAPVTTVNTLNMRNDRLGKLVQNLSSEFASAASWEDFVTQFRGRSYLSPDLQDLDHPAAELLRQWRDEGVPVNSTSPPWTDDQKDLCIRRGCHQSATQHSAFLRDEMAEFIESKFWVVLPYTQVRHLQQLMLTPAAVKEERARKPRLLCDHSWPWAWGSVNETTIPHAPPEAMQFGRALPRILRLVRHANPKFGPPRLNKQDVKDGFYRMFLRAADCLRLALLLPTYEGEPLMVGVPLACTMGWVESPPTFCAMSETVCDRANALFAASPLAAPPHRLNATAALLDDLDTSMTPRPREADDVAANAALAAIPGVVLEPPEPEHLAPPSNCAFNRPLGHTDVFVDDFIQLGQGSKRRMNALRLHLLAAIDEILARPTSTESHRNEAISLKKLVQGDGSWATRQLILGWIIDVLRQTLELPPHRKLALAEIFTSLASTKRVTVKRWQKILGKLRFVSQAIPGSVGLFCALQLALSRPSDGRIRITKALRHHITTFASLAASLCHRPTHLAEFVPQEPSLLGATDAAKPGMGGVYFDHTGRCFVWRFPFPKYIQDRLVSALNLDGSITNSDLEHCGLLGQVALMASTHDVRYATLTNGCDNTPAVSRVSKGAVSSDGPAAFLCNYACTHQRHARYCHLASYLPGPDNVMGDDASRLQHLTDSAFLSHFEQQYPQALPWELLHLPPETASALISALLCKPPPSPPPPRLARPNASSSRCGSSSAAASNVMLPSVLSLRTKTSSATCSSSPTDSEPQARPTSLSELIPWTRPYWRWARGSPTWVSRIPEKRLLDPDTTIPYSLLSSRPCPTKTAPPLGSTQPI
jgi:hypothetical protein